MSNTVYYCGYRLEQFNGPGNSGSPIYTSVTATDSSEYKKLGYITLGETTQNPNNWGYGALFGGFVDSGGASTKLDNFWVTAELGLRYSTLAPAYYIVTDISLNKGGFGYKVGDVITIPNCGTVTVDSTTDSGVDSSGTITSGDVTNETGLLTTDPTNTNVASKLIPGSGATFNVTSTHSDTTFTPASITLNASGKGYVVGDVITLKNTGTVTVDTVDSNGAILTITTELSKEPQTENMAGTGISGILAVGSGATFNITGKEVSEHQYVNESLQMVSGGSGYAVGDVLTLGRVVASGGSYQTIPVGTITVTSIGEGTIPGSEVSGTTYTAITNFTPYLDTIPSNTDLSGIVVMMSTSGSGSGATFTLTTSQNTYYHIDTISIANGGTGYKEGNVLIIGDSLATFVVKGSSIKSIKQSLDLTPNAVDMAGIDVSGTTNGKGLGATFNVTSKSDLEYGLLEYSPMVIHSTTNNVYVQLKASTTNINEYRIILCTSLTDISTYKDTGIVIPLTDTGSGAPPITRLSIRFTGFGTKSGSITAYVSAKKVGDWSGDLSAYSDFDQISFHKGSPDSLTNFYYCYVTDYPTRYSYLEYQVATELGSNKEWIGDLTTFPTYPVDYYAIGGLYATDSNQTVTFKNEGNFDTLIGYVPSAVVFSSALITDDDSTNALVAGVVKGTDTSKVSYTQKPNSDGSCITWYYGEDPVTSGDWTIDNVNNYEFGLERTE